MERPECVVNVLSMPRERRPKSTPTPGVSALVAAPGDATGLRAMGVHARWVEAGQAGTNRHFHDVEEEWAFVVKGAGSVRIADLRLPVRAGHFVGFPPGPRAHHFLADADQPLVLLEGGERRPDEDTFWYPDLQRQVRARQFDEPYAPPAEEAGNPAQRVHVSEAESWSFQHDVEPRARRSMRTLSAPAGLVRQVVCEARVKAGDLSTAFHTHEHTDEWVFLLEGQARARVGDVEFGAGPGDFFGHSAGSAPHVLEAVTDLVYLVGGQSDPDDVVTYPEAGLRRVGEKLMPL